MSTGLSQISLSDVWSFDYSNKKKETYFYAHDPFSNIVEMKKYPNFIRLIDWSQTLYLLSSSRPSECFIPDDVSMVKSIKAAILFDQ